jgi:predicted dehydrogenase
MPVPETAAGLQHGYLTLKNRRNIIMPEKLSAVLVGCGGMGRGQARTLAEHRDFDLLAVCDMDIERVKLCAEETGAEAYTDFSECLEKEKPDLAAITTPNNSHSFLTIMAAQAGVKGVYCEKPMAVNMKEANAMADACRKAGVKLVINHQRRIGADLQTARKLIETGAVGEVNLIKTNNAGDILSDGTHAIDNALFLAGDPDIEWILGQVHRDINDEMIERSKKQTEKTGRPVEPGTRYGHVVENGGFGIIQLANGIRLEIACGDMKDGYRAYQDYVVSGTKGSIWRTGDKPGNLFINTGGSGGWAAGIGDEWQYKPRESEGEGPWVPVEIEDGDGEHHIPGGYTKFARMIRNEEDHPMNGDNALRGFEAVMGIYESARLNRKLTLPLEQDRFPLEVMIETGSDLRSQKPQARKAVRCS